MSAYAAASNLQYAICACAWTSSWSSKTLDLLDHAKSLGFDLIDPEAICQRAQRVGIEPVNRYETFLINTCEQALALSWMIDEPNVGVHVDAYHMNTEATDFSSPTSRAAQRLCHFHLSESHRDPVGLESFAEPSLARAAATCVRCQLASSVDQSLREGLCYPKGSGT